MVLMGLWRGNGVESIVNIRCAHAWGAVNTVRQDLQVKLLLVDY